MTTPDPARSAPSPASVPSARGRHSAQNAPDPAPRGISASSPGGTRIDSAGAGTRRGGDRDAAGSGSTATAAPGNGTAPGSRPSGNTLAVETFALTKSFGQALALNAVSLAVPSGSVYGFLGRNGAGKTTAIRILLGLARATSGRAEILGAPHTDPAARARVGYLPDVPGFYPWMTAPEALRFAASLYRLPRSAAEERVEALLDLAGLSGVPQRVGGFSRGMTQRLGIAQALVNAPDLLILDEPTSALDPLGRRDVLSMIRSLAGRTTVMFSTHLLGDVEQVCDHVGILDHGVLRAQGSLTDVKAAAVTAPRPSASAASHEIPGSPGSAAAMSTPRSSAVVPSGRAAAPTYRLRVILDDDADPLARRFAGLPWCTAVTEGPEPEHTLTLAVTDRSAAYRGIPALVAHAGVGLVELRELRTTLEDAFVALVEGGVR